jgi:hypothetical protein
MGSEKLRNTLECVVNATLTRILYAGNGRHGQRHMQAKAWFPPPPPTKLDPNSVLCVFGDLVIILTSKGLLGTTPKHAPFGGDVDLTKSQRCHLPM